MGVTIIRDGTGQTTIRDEGVWSGAAVYVYVYKPMSSFERDLWTLSVVSR